MNKKLKIFFVMIGVIGIIVCANYQVFATVSGSDLVGSFNGTNRTNTDEGESLLGKVLTPVLSIVRIVAVGISIIMITFLGIKYMSAAPSEKASIKNQLIAFTIGAIVVIGATSILEIIKNAVTTVTTA